jgi:hypothetical protein
MPASDFASTGTTEQFAASNILSKFPWNFLKKEEFKNCSEGSRDTIMVMFE